MNELERIVRAAGTTDASLATVVRVVGSSHRRPGARMLIVGDRWIAGCVSGGCLEGDVLLRGAHRCKDGPVVITYDSTSDHGSEPYGLGCNGVVDILLEHIPAGATNDALAFAAACFAEERTGVLVTVIRSSRSEVPVGARCSIPEAAFANPIGDPAIRAMAARPAGVVEIDGANVLVETITPSPQLFVLGSGHDAAPIVPLAKSAGFRVTVADRAIREPSRFLAADRLAKSPDVPALIARALEAYVVIMHHHKEADRSALEMALASRSRYIGVLGPASRTRELLGYTPSDRRVHAPIGLDVGAETPEQIALSIVGEVQAVHHGARGGMLRDRVRPLHADVAIAVLAAGESKRLGRPKQLVELGGTPLVHHVAACCTVLRGGPVGVVIGAYAADVDQALGDLRVARVTNGAWSEGIASSIRAAVTWAESSRANALVIVLGDQPRIASAHLAALRDAWLAGAQIAASRYHSILGAPAIFDRSKWSLLAQLQGDQGAARLLYDESVTAIDWDGGELGGSIVWLRYSAATALLQNAGRAMGTAPGTFFHSTPEATGVVGVISPWNSPIILTVRAIGPALAAGCTVVLKLPGQTALTNGSTDDPDAVVDVVGRVRGVVGLRVIDASICDVPWVATGFPTMMLAERIAATIVAGRESAADRRRVREIDDLVSVIAPPGAGFSDGSEIVAPTRSSRTP